MTHAEIWEQEIFTSESESNWIGWINEAEKLAGHSLDGDQEEDGYSLDGCYDAFKRGFTPNDYMNHIHDEWGYKHSS